VLQACSTVAGILVLTNTDVLLARHYLDAETSGAYGIASLFAKAVLWLSQFVAQAAYPALAASGDRHRLLLRTLAGTAGVGLVGVVGTALLGGPLVRHATGGTEYDVSTGLLTAFALLGVAWSLAQVLLLAAVAVGDRRPGRLVWGLIAAEAGLIAAGPHGSAGEILAVCMVAVVLFVALVAVLEWAWPAAEVPKPFPALPPAPMADPATPVGPGVPAPPAVSRPDGESRRR
jgi:O-antigen/teichoic acid export membrane protein